MADIPWELSVLALAACCASIAMSSPSKKRKLNNDKKSTGTQSKGLEYFFSKQRQNGAAPSPSSSSALNETSNDSTSALTDEELARKLQAEWDEEAASEARSRDDALKTEVKAETVEPPVQELSSKAGLKSPSPSKSPSKLPEAAGESSVPAGNAMATLTLQSAGMAEDLITNTIPLDEPPLTFEPAKYVTALRQQWGAGSGDASYALLTRAFVLVSATAIRIKIVDTLVNCLRILIEGDPSSLLPAVSALPLEYVNPL